MSRQTERAEMRRLSSTALRTLISDAPRRTRRQAERAYASAAYRVSNNLPTKVNNAVIQWIARMGKDGVQNR